MNIEQLVAIIGGWSFLLIGVSTWVSHLLTERLILKWRNDEQRSLESLRNDLANSRSALDAAIRSHTSGQDLFQRRRLESVARIWAAVLQLRERLSGPVFFFGILLPSEYDSGLINDNIAASINELSDVTLSEIIRSTATIEADRPYLGEILWLRFFVYRAFLGRLAHVIVAGRERGHIQDWRTDDGVCQLLTHVLSADTVHAILESSTNLASVYHAISLLESLILEEISLIMSGQRSSVESFENTRQLRDALIRANL